MPESCKPQIEEAIRLLQPTAKGGNLWAGIWVMRLKLSLISGEDKQQVEWEDFQQSFLKLWEIFLSIRDQLVEWGLIQGGDDGGTPAEGS